MKRNIQVSKTYRSGNKICDNLCFEFPVLSLVSLAHVRLATSAQRISGLHVFLGFEVKLTLKKVLKKQGPGKSLKST